jgi:DNA-binding response OmpR family regulator
LTPIKIMLVGADSGLANLARDSSEVLQWCTIVMEPDSLKAESALLMEKVDGIILCAQMQGIDGFELTQKIRTSSLNSSAPIVMLTEDNSVNLMLRGFKAGVTFFSVLPSSRQRVYSLFNAVRGLMVRERRRHIRLPFRTRVTCRWGTHQEKKFVADSTTIGEGGISLRPSGGLSVGQEVALVFDIPKTPGEGEPSGSSRGRSIFAEPGSGENDAAELRGIVRWEKAAEGVGIEFLQLPQAYRQYIIRHVSGAVEDD